MRIKSLTFSQHSQLHSQCNVWLSVFQASLLFLPDLTVCILFEILICALRDVRTLNFSKRDINIQNLYSVLSGKTISSI